jgi:hypothetical protein
LRKGFLTSFSIALRAFSVFFFAIVGFLIRCNVTVIQYGPCAAPHLSTFVAGAGLSGPLHLWKAA